MFHLIVWDFSNTYEKYGLIRSAVRIKSDLCSVNVSSVQMIRGTNRESLTSYFSQKKPFSISLQNMNPSSDLVIKEINKWGKSSALYLPSLRRCVQMSPSRSRQQREAPPPVHSTRSPACILLPPRSRLNTLPMNGLVENHTAPSRCHGRVHVRRVRRRSKAQKNVKGASVNPNGILDCH